MGALLDRAWHGLAARGRILADVAPFPEHTAEVAQTEAGLALAPVPARGLRPDAQRRPGQGTAGGRLRGEEGAGMVPRVEGAAEEIHGELEGAERAQRRRAALPGDELDAQRR